MPAARLRACLLTAGLWPPAWRRRCAGLAGAVAGPSGRHPWWLPSRRCG